MLVRTGDAAAAALVVAATGVAQIVGTAFVGPLVDRFGARRVAVLADLGSAVSVAALALFGDSAGIAALTALAVAGALFDVPGMTARQTLLPRVADATGIGIGERDLVAKAALLDDPDYVALTADYDAALDWSPDDPRLADLLAATSAWTERHAGTGGDAAPPAPVAAVLESIEVRAPAWEELRRRMARQDASGP